jgi:hypothetical protein
MGNPRLRDLARAYAQGRIAQADYRARRAALLDELMRADVTAFDTRPDETRPGARAQGPRTEAAPAAPAPKGGGAGKAILAVVVLAALAGGGVYAVRNGMLSTGPAAQTSRESAPESAPPAAAPATDPLARILARPDWDVPRLERFLSEWRALPAAERDRLEKTPSFQYLADALYRRQAEQTALADLGNADARDRVRRISAVMAAVGLDPDHR